MARRGFVQYHLTPASMHDGWHSQRDVRCSVAIQHRQWEKKSSIEATTTTTQWRDFESLLNMQKWKQDEMDRYRQYKWKEWGRSWVGQIPSNKERIFCTVAPFCCGWSTSLQKNKARTPNWSKIIYREWENLQRFFTRLKWPVCKNVFYGVNFL
jgi:hypothetical protein